MLCVAAEQTEMTAPTEPSTMVFTSRAAALPVLPAELPPPVLTPTATTAVRGLVPTAAMLGFSHTLKHDRTT
jgi:hypothetical protein